MAARSSWRFSSASAIRTTGGVVAGAGGVLGDWAGILFSIEDGFSEANLPRAPEVNLGVVFCGIVQEQFPNGLSDLIAFSSVEVIVEDTQTTGANLWPAIGDIRFDWFQVVVGVDIANIGDVVRKPRHPILGHLPVDGASTGLDEWVQVFHRQVVIPFHVFDRNLPGREPWIAKPRMRMRMQQDVFKHPVTGTPLKHAQL